MANDDLMKGYRRIVVMRGDGTPDRPCQRLFCGETAAWRVAGIALCDRHAREKATKIKNRGKK